MTSPRFATLARRAVVVFVTAWAIRSLIVSGGGVLNEHYRSVILNSPWTTQATSGDGFEQSLVRIRASIPTSDRVAVVWPNAPDYYYAYFWSTFWLFPRKVAVDTSARSDQHQGADALVLVRRPTDPTPGLAGYSVVTVYTFHDYVVSTLERDG